MLRFFSSIRKKLIGTGHLSRYFWYAIGEIILVMIGILLALQVNNWNEDRLALNETKDYLSKKLYNLNQDAAQLKELSAYRSEVITKATGLLDRGYEQASDYEIVNLVLIATVERKLTSMMIEQHRDNTPTYFKNIAGTGIEQLEQHYLNLVDKITFAETRYNLFSEELESDLWRTGYFTENRDLFTKAYSYSRQQYESSDLPPLKRKQEYAIKSLMAILHRNEINSSRLVERYRELLQLNQELKSAIARFISTKN